MSATPPSQRFPFGYYGRGLSCSIGNTMCVTEPKYSQEQALLTLCEESSYAIMIIYYGAEVSLTCIEFMRFDTRSVIIIMSRLSGACLSARCIDSMPHLLVLSSLGFVGDE